MSMSPIIASAGIYEGIPMSMYHGHEEICPGPSISSSGLKLISQCPIKYWVDSPLNRSRRPKAVKAHFSFGNAAHHYVIEGESGFFQKFHVTPEGFALSKTKMFADEIEEAKQAEDRGKIIVSSSDFATIKGMAAAIDAHPIAKAAFSSCIVEPTLAWQHKETGIWLRVRPDALPHRRLHIPDYKTTANASPSAFSKSVWNFGYHMSSALYLDGIQAIFGERPKTFFYVAQEKEYPYVIEIYEIDQQSLTWGGLQNERAIKIFADCLHRDIWPGYNSDVAPITLPKFAQYELQEMSDFGFFDVTYEDVQP